MNGAVEGDLCDREIVDRRLRRAVIAPDSIKIQLKALDAVEEDEPGAMELILIPFAPPLLTRKGVAHAPARNETLSDASQTALLIAIAKAKRWAEAAFKDPAFDFAALAVQERLSARYIRLLMPLAFLSPKVVDAIADGEVPADLTSTALSRNLPLAWAEQERRLRLSRA